MLTFTESGHPVFPVTSPLSENCQYTIALTKERLKLFFAQIFLFISSVFSEQSKKFVKNANPAIIEQGDLLWKNNLTHRSSEV